MNLDEARVLAKEFDFAGEIIAIEDEMAAGIGPGRMLIVKAPGEPPRVGREAVEFLRQLLRHLSAKQDQAIHAITMIAEGSHKEVLDGERIALAILEKESGYRVGPQHK